MPELPEVHTIVGRLQPFKGARILDFSATWARQVVPSISEVRRQLVGTTIAAISRRGKYIIFHLQRAENGHLASRSAPSASLSYFIVHLRMSGRFETDVPLREHSHIRATLTFADQRRLHFVDARKFGRLEYSDDYRHTLSHLGVEPLERGFTAQTLYQLLQSRTRALKPLLLDQHVIAGLGNIYCDEALHMAALHPLTPSNALSFFQVQKLQRAIRKVLRKGITHNGTSLDWIYPEGNMQDFLQVYGRRNQPCPRCRTPIAYCKIAQRGTHFCPSCQVPQENK